MFSRIQVYSPFVHERERFFSRVTIWDGGEIESAICTRRPTSPPETFSITKNISETVEFVDRIRRGIFNPAHEGKRGSFVDRRKSTPRISGYSDFSKISEIDTAAAVLLTAEYARAARLKDQIPPCINLDEWHKSVFTKLFEIGFFEILGLSQDVGPQVIDKQDTKVMRLVAMRNTERLPEIDAHLAELGRFLHADEEEFYEATSVVLTAMSEAIANVTNHAYPDGHAFAVPHIGQLWISASANRVTKELSVVVYDQGATIPVTYSLQTWQDRAVEMFRSMTDLDFLPGRTPEPRHDDVYIEIATKLGSSQTKDLHRGKGLPQMCSLLKHVGNGTMSIVSRNGWCKFGSMETEDRGTLPASVGGTLVEWTFKI